MFDDPRSRRAWRIFHLRAELMLGGVSRDIRRQLLEDLSAHVRDAVDHRPKDVPEHERVAAALARMGEPREFIAPLLADAILERKRRIGPQTGLRGLILNAQRGAGYFVKSATIAAMFAVGALLIAVAIGGILRPNAIGVFKLGEGEYQLRLFGFAEAVGDAVLYPWLGLAFALVGGALVWFAWRRLRNALSEMLMSG
jgi:hypothetical protein